jgi:hypothetical protein
MPSTKQFLGFDNFVWFQGVVEDRFDPLKLGRVRVRILGLHTDNKKLIPTEDLPWAFPISPITSAAISDVGESPLGPLPGTWVVGFFRDGENCQEPVVFGTLAGIPQDLPNGRIGFNDPKENYPKIDHVPENDVHRLARRENIEKTIVPKKFDTLDLNVEKAQDKSGSRGEPWNEPDPGYNAQYPHNHVWETESGHTFEWDDTPNNERIHEYHKTGTFYEIQADGTKVTKVVRDNYHLTYGDEYIHIHGNANIRIGGSREGTTEGCNVLIVGNANIEVQKEAYVVTGDNTKIDVHGNLDLSVDDDFNIQVGGDMSVGVQGNYSLQAQTVNMTGLESSSLFGGSYAGVTSLGQATLSGMASVQVTGAKVGLQANALLNLGGGVVDIGSLGVIKIATTGDVNVLAESITNTASSVFSALAPSVTRGGSPFWN